MNHWNLKFFSRKRESKWMGKWSKIKKLKRNIKHTHILTHNTQTQSSISARSSFFLVFARFYIRLCHLICWYLIFSLILFFRIFHYIWYRCFVYSLWMSSATTMTARKAVVLKYANKYIAMIGIHLRSIQASI